MYTRVRYFIKWCQGAKNMEKQEYIHYHISLTKVNLNAIELQLFPFSQKRSILHIYIFLYQTFKEDLKRLKSSLMKEKKVYISHFSHIL